MTELSLPDYVVDGDLDRLIQSALAEDIGHGDVTSLHTIESDYQTRGVVLAKDSGTVAGLYVADRVFELTDPDISISWSTTDGTTVDAGQEFGLLSGPARSILGAERVALNFMQRMSGIASETARFVEAVGGYPARILDTRKTAPGLRALDKWAVLLGGGMNHRVGLYDMVLIKDNHIAASGGVENAIRSFTDSRNLLIEIEAKTLEQVKEIVRLGGIDRILLDNMVRVDTEGSVDCSKLKQAVELIDGKFQTEASGNVTLRTVGAIAATGVDYISSGALTHSVKAFDISLNLAT